MCNNFGRQRCHCRLALAGLSSGRLSETKDKGGVLTPPLCAAPPALSSDDGPKDPRRATQEDN